MNILSAQNVTKRHGIKLLFENISFGLEDDDRVGIIGVNGSGKSTFLKVLAGSEPADAGQVVYRQGLKVDYAPQNPEFDPAHTVLDHIFASQTELSGVLREYEELCARMEQGNSQPGDDDRMTRAMAQLDALGGWEYEVRAKTVLTQLGVRDLDAAMGTLSGGYRKRVALARALLMDADLLILDEPTNHLDANTISWLEDYLNRMSGALLLVTHDRYFLDRVTRRIVELDGGELFVYDGNFSYYLERKAEQEAAVLRADDRRRSILRKELEWLGRGARARRTKEKHRIDRIQDLKNAAPARRADPLKFESGGRRLGSKIIELDKVTKSLGGRVLIKDYSHAFAPGERLGIVGPNGSGKTTLVNIITGRLQPDSGTVDMGSTVEFGFFDQESAELDMDERAIDYVKRDGGAMLRGADGSVMTAERMMERFLFTPQMLFQPVGKLSGGERRRLHLVRTLMKDPNFLILDEPTNDLDIPTLQALEDFLDGFGGCLLVVSHDRYFLDRTVDKLLALEDNGVLRLYPGDYTLYEQMREDFAAEASDSTQEKKPRSQPASDQRQPDPASKKKLSYKEQRELETLEQDIETWEKRLEEIPPELDAAANDYMALQELTREQTELQEKLDKGVERWQHLAERA